MLSESAIRYRLLAISPQGEGIDLTDAVTSLTRSEEPNALAEQLSVEVPNHDATPLGWLHTLIPLGARLVLWADEGGGLTEVNSYTVFSWSHRDRGDRVLSLTAYDPLIYLLRSKGDAFFRAGTTARAIIEDLAAEWQVPIVSLADGLDVPLGKQVYRAKTVADMMRTALAAAHSATGIRFHLQHGPGGIRVRREGGNAPTYWLQGADVVGEVEDRRDMEDLVTRVLILGSAPDGGRAPVVAQLDGLTEFGVLQEIVTAAQNDSGGKARTAAETLLRERGIPRQKRRVTSLDVPSLRRGDLVRITAGTLDGYYLINGVTRDLQDRSMTIEVRTPAEGLELYQDPNSEEGEERAGRGAGTDGNQYTGPSLEQVFRDAGYYHEQ